MRVVLFYVFIEGHRLTVVLFPSDVSRSKTRQWAPNFKRTAAPGLHELACGERY